MNAPENGGYRGSSIRGRRSEIGEARLRCAGPVARLTTHSYGATFSGTTLLVALALPRTSP